MRRSLLFIKIAKGICIIPLTAVTNYNKLGGSEAPNQFQWVKVLVGLGSLWKL